MRSFALIVFLACNYWGFCQSPPDSNQIFRRWKPAVIISKGYVLSKDQKHGDGGVTFYQSHHDVAIHDPKGDSDTWSIWKYDKLRHVYLATEEEDSTKKYEFSLLKQPDGSYILYCKKYKYKGGNYFIAPSKEIPYLSCPTYR